MYNDDDYAIYKIHNYIAIYIFSSISTEAIYEYINIIRLGYIDFIFMLYTFVGIVSPYAYIRRIARKYNNTKSISMCVRQCVQLKK